MSFKPTPTSTGWAEQTDPGAIISAPIILPYTHWLSVAVTPITSTPRPVDYNLARIIRICLCDEWSEQKRKTIEKQQHAEQWTTVVMCVCVCCDNSTMCVCSRAHKPITYHMNRPLPSVHPSLLSIPPPPNPSFPSRFPFPQDAPLAPVPDIISLKVLYSCLSSCPPMPNPNILCYPARGDVEEHRTA
jgi:hypothetical protein